MPPPSLASSSKADPLATSLATETLLTLVSLTSVAGTEDTDQEWEIAAGCLDIIEAESGSHGINGLFQAIRAQDMAADDPEAARFVLKLVSETLSLIDENTFRYLVLPCLQQ